MSYLVCHMTLEGMLENSPILELAARIPVNLETQNVQRGGRNYRPPKWFQFIPRSVIGTPWLEGLLDEDLPPRNRIILADEGGMGKTKSSVITINHILFENPQLPVLIICPRRVIPDWRRELEEVMRNVTVIGNVTSSAMSILRNPLPGNVYIVSKHSFSKNFNRLVKQTNWNEKKVRFSLLVIDEAHQGKADKNIQQGYSQSDKIYEEEFSGKKPRFKSSALYQNIQKLSLNYCTNVLAVTASPLSLDITELVNLAKLIGVDKQYYEKLEDVPNDQKKNLDFLRRWHTSFEPCRKLISKNDNVADSDINLFIWDIKQALDFLPHKDKLKKSLGDDNNSKWLESTNRRITWLNELNPLAPFLTVTFRADLGSKSKEIFRTRVTKTCSIKLHDAHLRELNRNKENEEKIGIIQRYNQSWPTNHIKGTDQRSYGENELFDYDDTDSINEPRLQKILDEIIPSDPAFEDKTNKKQRGAVIFANVVRTVHQISRGLNKRTIEVNGQNITIKTHIITGDVDGAVAKLKEISLKNSKISNEYHVVVGTSAIQEGLSMNWATTVIHWDLVSNPQILEQRSWRLDRHMDGYCNEKFQVIYLVTDSESDKEMVEIISKRAKLYSSILNQEFSPYNWPSPYNENQPFSEPFIREYVNQERSFFHEKAKDLAGIWYESEDLEKSQIEQVRNLQQKAIFIGLSDSNNWDLDVNQMTKNRLIDCKNLKNSNSKECDKLRKLIVLADNHDRATLQSLHPQSVWDFRPYLDNQQAKRDLSGRFFSAAFDPSGLFMKRVLRRTRQVSKVIRGPQSGKKMIIASIDCTNRLKNYNREISVLDTLLNENPTNIYRIKVSEKSIIPVVLSSDTKNLKSMLQNSLKRTFVDYPGPDLTNYLQDFVNQKIVKITNRLEQLEDKYLHLDDDIGSLRQQERITSDPKYSRIIAFKERQQKSIQDMEIKLEDWKTYLLSAIEDSSYQITPRYVEGY